MDALCTEIDSYLTSPDYAIILYSVIRQAVNRFVSDGNRVVVFSFSSSRELLSWLKTSKSAVHDKVQLRVAYTTLDLFQQMLLTCGDKNHIKVVQDSMTNENAIVLVITSEEAIHSVTSLEMVTDPSLFEEFRTRHQILVTRLENKK